MVRLTRCPLSVKFGRDVAGLIYLEVWRQLIRVVNKQYHENFRGETVIHRPTGFCFNYREYNVQHVCNLLITIKTKWKGDNVVSDLPRNYWQIKELY